MRHRAESSQLDGGKPEESFKAGKGNVMTREISLAAWLPARRKAGLAPIFGNFRGSFSVVFQSFSRVRQRYL